MSKRTFGILALVGSVIGAWWMVIQRRARNTPDLIPARDHGTMIFETPAEADIDAIL